MLLAVFLALGCGAPKSRTPVVVKAVEVPAAPPFIAPGERISFRVNLHEVTLASFALVAGDIEMVAGHKAIVVQAGAQSEGLAAMVKPVKAEFTSWIDVETGAPVMFRAVEAAGRGDETIERVEARFTEKTGNAFAITTTPADQAPLEQQQTTTSIPSDLIAML